MDLLLEPDETSLFTLLITHLTFFASLTTSVILYRTLPFHPLSRVPGSFIHKITKFYAVWRCYRGDLHVKTKAMHDRFGPIVRIGTFSLSPTNLGIHAAFRSERDLRQRRSIRPINPGNKWSAKRSRYVSFLIPEPPVPDQLIPLLLAYLISKLAGQPPTLVGSNGPQRTDRRRVWMRGFKAQSLKEYQPIIVQKAGHLRDALLLRKGEVDLMRWFNYFS